MKDYQREFIAFAIQQQVLRFGEFTLKSGRVSPFFFNAGLFNDGQALAKLGEFYAHAIEDFLQKKQQQPANNLLLFGPAYKGIPLVASTAIALYHGPAKRNLPYAFNRKEAKDHGEGGSIVGTPLEGRSVIVVDDVITAGTAIRESMAIIQQAKDARLHAVVVALDRQEKGRDAEWSAIQEIERTFGVPVISIVSLADVVEFLRESGEAAQSQQQHLENIEQYRRQYGV